MVKQQLLPHSSKKTSVNLAAFFLLFSLNCLGEDPSQKQF